MAIGTTKKNAIMNVIKSLMALLFPLITFPYSSRILLPDGIGRVRFAESVVSYFSLLSGLGILSYAYREIINLRNDQYKLNKFCKEILLINTISMSFAYILLFLTIFFVPRLRTISLLIFISSLSIFFNTVEMKWLFQGFEEYTYITIRSIFFQIFSLVLLFTLVKDKDDFLWYAALNVIAASGASICNIVYSKKFISLKGHYKLELKKHIRPILTFFLLSVVFEINNILDTSMLGFLSSEKEVGYYTAATKINKMILTLITAAFSVVFPRLASYANAGNTKDLKLLFEKTISFTLCFSIPSIIGLYLLSEPITLLFSGDHYLPAIKVMKTMTPIILFIPLSNLFGSQYLVAIRKEKLQIISIFIGVIVNFISNCFLIPHFGSLGAGYGTIIAEFFIFASTLLFTTKFININSVWTDFFQYLISASIMGLLVFYLSTFFQNNFFKIFICTTCGAFVYAIVLIFFKNKIALIICKTIATRLKFFFKESKK